MFFGTSGSFHWIEFHLTDIKHWISPVTISVVFYTGIAEIEEL